MKYLYSSILILITSFSVSASSLSFARKLGGTSTMGSTAVVCDNSNNYYLTGSYKGITDFDPSAATVNKISSSLSDDIFLAKYSSTGNYISVASIGGSGMERANSMAIDNNGNVYITGFFQSSTVDFDPSASTANVSLQGGSDMFLAKYNSSGVYQWAFGIGSSGNACEGYHVSLDATGTGVYVTGYFQGTLDIDPSGSTTNITSAGINDIMIIKYDNGGNFVWGGGIGSDDYDQGQRVTVNSTGDVLLTGYFRNTADFNIGSGTTSLTSFSSGKEDIFLASYTSAGALNWVKQLGGTEQEQAVGMATDSDGNIFLTGSFLGTADMDPSANTANITAQSSYADVFVAKYSSAGSYLWAKGFGGTNPDVGVDVKTDGDGNVYTLGLFEVTADFDPDPTATHNATSNGDDDFFISLLDVDGNFVQVVTFGGTGTDAFLKDANNTLTRSTMAWMNDTLMAVGTFSSTIDFDPTSGTYNLTASLYDAFLAGYKFTPPVVTPPTAVLSSKSLKQVSVYPSPSVDGILSLDIEEPVQEIILTNTTGVSESFSSFPVKTQLNGLLHLNIRTTQGVYSTNVLVLSH